MKRLIKIAGLLVIVFAVFFAKEATAQKKLIQLSGVILANDSVNPVPGAHIYAPEVGRGTISNSTGFFSLPLLTGDSVVFSSLGFKRKSYKIPDDAAEYTTLIVVMSENTTILDSVVVTAFPTLEIFKSQVLAMNDPSTTGGIDGRQLNSELMALMIRTTPMDASANYNYYMKQYPQDIQNKFMPITNPFLNVVNWAKFFKQMKQQKKEREKESQRNRIPD